jgi:uncharacterized protein YjiS (DUF1127 family)
MRHETFDTGSIDVRSLSAAQRHALQHRLIREAHGARIWAIRLAFARVSMFLRRLRSAIVVQAMRDAVNKAWAWTAHIRRRERLEGLASLRAMTDYELRDIGLSRSEVRAASLAGERDATSQDWRPL